MLRKMGSVVAAAAFFATSTMAIAGTDAQQQGALAPGNAAGVQQAQGMTDNTTMLLVATTFTAIGLCLVLCGKNGNGTPSTVTTQSP